MEKIMIQSKLINNLMELKGYKDILPYNRIWYTHIVHSCVGVKTHKKICFFVPNRVTYDGSVVIEYFDSCYCQSRLALKSSTKRLC